MSKRRFKTIRRIISGIVIIMFLLSNQNLFDILRSINSPQLVEAATQTMTTRNDWEDAIYNSNELDTHNSIGDLQLKGGAVGNWPGLAIPPSSITSGSAAEYVSDNNSLYVINGGRNFYRYDIGEDYWESLAITPYDISTGGGLAWDQDNTIYALRGGNTTGFYKYTISTNTWTTLTDPPAETYGGSITYDILNDKVYVLRADGTSAF